MRKVTYDMIKHFEIREKCDFMGYDTPQDILTFHHLIVPHRLCRIKHIPNDGYIWENGAILYRKPHDYIHVLERYDLDRFNAVTSEMVDMNILGRLDKENLLRIHDILSSFEREYSGKTKHGKPIIKEEYTKRLVKKW